MAALFHGRLSKRASPPAEAVSLASAAEGIFAPPACRTFLASRQSVPKPKGRVWYHDQTPPELTAAGDTLSYAFTGVEPENTRNQWLRQAMADQVPLIYFFGVAPGLYQPLFPTFVTEWQPEKLRCGLSFSAAVQTETNISQAPLSGATRFARLDSACTRPSFANASSRHMATAVRYPVCRNPG